ncbi:hypothetical protein [Nocardia carnea]|uniref:hypothetical protein n=1 Tax=Nocardia carnea TaxID=37328 RepID=UPI0024548082|nr:hypothetical protein [Nocardia carnea]
MRLNVGLWLGVVVFALVAPQVVGTVLMLALLAAGSWWVLSTWVRNRRWVK